MSQWPSTEEEIMLVGSSNFVCLCRLKAIHFFEEFNPTSLTTWYNMRVLEMLDYDTLKSISEILQAFFTFVYQYESNARSVKRSWRAFSLLQNFFSLILDFKMIGYSVDWSRQCETFQVPKIMRVKRNKCNLRCFTKSFKINFSSKSRSRLHINLSQLF